MLTTMKEILDRASRENYAVIAPNVDNELNARACIEAAELQKAPLILDVAAQSVVDLVFFGKMLTQLAQQSCVPIAINLDHGGNKTDVLKAIQGGFTSVMFDRSSLSNEQNITEVKEIVEIAHTAGISVEAELGHVGQATNYTEDRDAKLTVPQEAADYIKQTGVDCLAVAIGTAHGAYPRGFTPYLDFDRLRDIKKITGNFPLVLHGSSGTDDESLRKACSLGINKVNIANDLYRAAVVAVKENDFEGNKAYDVFVSIKKAIIEKMIKVIDLSGSKGKAWTIIPQGLPKGQTKGEEE
ncbi:MAG: class II fructose-bisphosphate aldolase [Erysipelotrichaceae bacterium]|nr:class II fructose-bisphosphate aldolase [Erysipelotrichaceae bacterium]